MDSFYNLSRKHRKLDHDSMYLDENEYQELVTYRKKFRTFEYSQNGNTWNRWKYDQDVKNYTCGDTEYYYQKYDYIYIEDRKYEHRSIVWDDAIQKMILLPVTSNQTDFCTRISQASDYPKFELRFDFDDMKDCLMDEVLFTNCQSHE